MADFTPPPLDSIENDKFVPPSLDSVESFTPPSVESVGERVIDDPSVTSITARTTGYHAVSPESPEFRMEGGNQDKMGNPLHTLDAFYRGQVPWVGLAGDPRIPYGTSATSPQFPGVPFRIVDTGSAFKNAGLSHFDIARDTAEGANADENNRHVQFDISSPNFALAQGGEATDQAAPPSVAPPAATPDRRARRGHWRYAYTNADSREAHVHIQAALRYADRLRHGAPGCPGRRSCPATARRDKAG